MQLQKKHGITANQTEDKREKIQSLSLAKECYSMKLDLLTNVTVVDDAIRFVSNHNNGDNCDKEKQEHISNYQAENRSAVFLRRAIGKMTSPIHNDNKQRLDLIRLIMYVRMYDNCGS